MHLPFFSSLLLGGSLEMKGSENNVTSANPGWNWKQGSMTLLQFLQCFFLSFFPSPPPPFFFSSCVQDCWNIPFPWCEKIPSSIKVKKGKEKKKKSKSWHIWMWLLNGWIKMSTVLVLSLRLGKEKEINPNSLIPSWQITNLTSISMQLNKNSDRPSFRKEQHWP